MADEPKAETITIPKAQYNKLSQRASQRAWWEERCKKLQATLEEEGGELPPGPDLVTLHATTAAGLVAVAATREKPEAALDIAECTKIAGTIVKDAIAFAVFVAAGEHSPDAGDMAESELSSDETLKRMKDEVARGGETGA